VTDLTDLCQIRYLIQIPVLHVYLVLGKKNPWILRDNRVGIVLRYCCRSGFTTLPLARLQEQPAMVLSLERA
jgi:hypothetical protein